MLFYDSKKLLFMEVHMEVKFTLTTNYRMTGFHEACQNFEYFSIY